MADEQPLTELIRRAQSGDSEALGAVFKAAYDDLRTLARQRLRDNRRGTYLDTTALVHESFLRFLKLGRLTTEDRQSFLRYAGQVMRSVIVDYARERLAERRGGGVAPLTLSTQIGDADVGGETEILQIHEALTALARHDERMAQIVELRYFAGMSETDIAKLLDVTDRTVRREWAKARVWLAAALE
jgi:RNA polymerase sigma factor (TIGR02999 family)